MSEQQLPQPRNSMREALEKEEAATKGGANNAGSNDEMAAREIQVVREAYRRDAASSASAYVMPEEPPAGVELVGWYLYGFCSYFVTVVLLPVIFPAIITQVVFDSSPTTSIKDAACSVKEMSLYQRLVKHSIIIGVSKLSPLNWTALSWAIGIIIAAPILTQATHHLDRGQHQSLILIAATSVGSFFCLLTGFFKTVWIFPFYILFIAASAVIADAVHTRNLGLMIRGLASNDSGKMLILRRRAAASQLALYVTAIGGLGAALLAAFTYHMLRRNDQFTGLWVVSIFCGLIWFIGICHGLFSNRPGASHDSPFEPNFLTKFTYSLSLVNYPQAIGSLVAVFLSSFSTMCIFTSGTLYVIGGVCIRPVLVLCLWILYFLFPLISLPILHPLQLIIRADAIRMQLLGFIISAFVSGAGFYFQSKKWSPVNVIVVALVQSTATGVLHAFGRVLLLDCSPPGKEGVFGSWYAFVRAIGACIGFAIGSASPGHAGGPFGAAFLGSFLGIIVLIFGNVSNVGALVAAGHVKCVDDEKRLGVIGMDKVGEGGVADSGEEYGRVRV